MELNSVRQSGITAEQALLSPVRTFEVSNSKGTRLLLSECGAAVVSLFVADRNGNFEDVVLGYDQLKDYLEDDYYLGTVVGRHANRIAGDIVVIDAQRYQLFTAKEGYHQHGGIEGFNKKIFKGTAFQNASGNGVVFTYTSPDLEEGFPGEFALKVIYTLDETNVWTIEYEGVSTKTTLVNLTQHSYFNLSGNPASLIDDHEFRIFCNWYLPVNHLQVPTGEIAAVANTPFDFTAFRKIKAEHLDNNAQLRLSNGYDHSFVLEKQHSKKLKLAVTVKEPVSGRQLDVFTTEPSVHFYTGNYLEGVKGKQEIVYTKRSGFCLETQHFPDAPNHPHFPSTELKAGELFYSKTQFQFSTC